MSEEKKNWMISIGTSSWTRPGLTLEEIKTQAQAEAAKQKVAPGEKVELVINEIVPRLVLTVERPPSPRYEGWAEVHR